MLCVVDIITIGTIITEADIRQITIIHSLDNLIMLIVDEVDLMVEIILFVVV